MSEVVEGSNAPEITLSADNGESVTLTNHAGKQLVVYFYPKDDTPGCTKEAIAFSGLLKEFAEQHTQIVGISPDGIAKHQKFIKKHDLAVTLLADENKEAAEAFGVWVEKSMYGRKYMGVERSTFIIDKAGKIAKIWRKVKVAGHAEEVLEVATALNS